MTAPVVDAEPLITAIKGAVTAAGVLIADSRKPDGVGNKPYIVAFFDAGRVEDKSLRSRDGFSLYASFQCAGLEPWSARFAVHRLRQAVLSMAGTSVGGMTVLMPSHEYPGPMTRDDDADPALFVQIDEWRFRVG